MLITKGKTDCEPSELGYDKDREQVLITHFERLIENKVIRSACYCVTKKGKVILHGAVGPATIKKGCQEPLQPDSIHFVASITKVFCAVAVMQLIENGLARLDTCVGEILPEFATPPYDKITLFQLLTHTSGLEPDMNTYEDKYRRSPWDYVGALHKLVKDKENFDWVAAALTSGLRRKPGTEWQYCTFGFVFLGAVIEKLSGEFANDYIEKHILEPLHMTSSGFKFKKDRIPRMYLTDKEDIQYAKKVLAGKASEVMFEDTIWGKIPATGGGMMSSAYDLTKFGNMMLNMGRLDGTRILGRKTVEKMTTNQLFGIPDYCWDGDNPSRSYGIGFDIRPGIAYHYSDGTYMHEGAGACSLIMDPVEDMVASWFVPFADDEWHAEALYNVTNIIWSGLI